MTPKLKSIFSKFNTINIILLGCIFGILLVLNSNYVNEKKAQVKLNKEQDALFKKLISKRKLSSVDEDGEEYIYLTDEVCSRGSEDLEKYYKTNDLSLIDLDDGAIKCEDKDKDYMKALIELVRGLVDKNDDNDNDNDGDGTRRMNNNPNLRNLIDDDDKENIKKYGKRVLPMLVFLVIGVLSIIGYLFCWISCCCNCCLCCCCKKPGCKIPCFLFTYVFYALVVAVCIYGLSQTKNIFTGLADTECSLLQFFDQILYGEIKETTPKWIGINKIDTILTDLHSTIQGMQQDNLVEELDYHIGNIDSERNNFMSNLQSLHTKFYDPNGIDYLSKYTITFPNPPQYYYNSQNLDGKYVLDVIQGLGKYDGTQFTNGLIKGWNDEISTIDGEASGSLSQARESFNNMLGEGGELNDILDALDKGKTELGKIKDPFDSVYNDISDILYDASEIMDKKGKSVVSLIFSLLMAMNICLAVLMLFICMFSGQSCVNCSFCRCIFKFATHILWNILAILMILSFLIGSILGLIGRVGGDMMSLISYIISEENFHNTNNPVLLGELGDGKDVLEECILGNGDLSQQFGFDDVSEDFNTISQKKRDIEEYMETFRSLAMNYHAYNILVGALKNRTEFIDDTQIINCDTTTSGTDVLTNVNISQIITKLNDASQPLAVSGGEKWNVKTGDKSFECITGPDGTPNTNLLHPWTCEPIYRDWVESLIGSNPDLSNYAQVTTDIIELLKRANDTTTDPENNYYKYLDDTKRVYTQYLNTYLEVLGFFHTVISDVVGAFEEGNGGSSDTFSFLNGKFIKTNIKIILKYLKYSLGKDIYTVGICLIIIGCSLILSVSSTILLIVIINVDLEQKKKLVPNTEIPEYAETNAGRIIKYKY